MAVAERAFASALEAMTDEELFTMMADLEIRSETWVKPSPQDEDFAKIVLTESAIERRFPGQMLKPYKEWQIRRARRNCARNTHWDRPICLAGRPPGD
ncbi:hypothetical protein [Rhizobium leguminosarum]|uniref:hypothetical protein n=2 Tax=Rhizobium leguminosarum TaxID=384 RepID=UPI001FD9A9C4|nr:hypothetical protein [Rhizobium leguminosarum]